MSLPINEIVCGDCREVMETFPEESIDLAVTSPPYWGLRDYGHDDQIGLEDHPQKYIDEMVITCREIKRVLKPSGSFWLNLGDTYYGSGGAGGDYNEGGLKEGQPKYRQNKSHRTNWLQPKQLLGIPWRVATALQNDGWILRNCVVWYKPNHMPESVKDRLTKSYEFFFFFVKQQKYYFDLDEIRVPHIYDDLRDRFSEKTRNAPKGVDGRGLLVGKNKQHPNGKNPGDMWQISTQGFPGSHFAVFPESLIEPIIKSSSPNNGIVLDPFAGSGTTCYVARKLGRRFIGIELNEEYANMAWERVRGRTFKRDLSNVQKLDDIL